MHIVGPVPFFFVLGDNCPIKSTINTNYVIWIYVIYLFNFITLSVVYHVAKEVMPQGYHFSLTKKT